MVLSGTRIMGFGALLVGSGLVGLMLLIIHGQDWLSFITHVLIIPGLMLMAFSCVLLES